MATRINYKGDSKVIRRLCELVNAAAGVAVIAFEVDPDTEQYPGVLKLSLADGSVFRVKPSDPDKQDKLTWDTAPTAGSSNAVSSGAVRTALDAKADPTVSGNLLLSADWTGTGPYTQTINLAGATTHSKIDLQPNATVLSQLVTDGVTALWVENNAGTLTAYALGAAPTAALTVQYTRTEVSE